MLWHIWDCCSELRHLTLLGNTYKHIFTLWIFFSYSFKLASFILYILHKKTLFARRAPLNQNTYSALFWAGLCVFWHCSSPITTTLHNITDYKYSFRHSGHSKSKYSDLPLHIYFSPPAFHLFTSHRSSVQGDYNNLSNKASEEKFFQIVCFLLTWTISCNVVTWRT